MTILRTPRLVLRPFRKTDRDAFFAVFSHPDAMRYWSTLPHKSPDETKRLIDETLGADPETSLEFAITLEGRVIGKAGLWRFPEIGYILHPDHWRRGYAEEALRAVIGHAFSERGLRRIVADIDTDNVASIGLLEKLGFVETGRAEKTIEIAGTWYDSIYYALDAPHEKDPPA